MCIKFLIPAAIVSMVIGCSPLPVTPMGDAVSEPRGGVGYSSVVEALEAVKARPGIKIAITKPDSWVIANEENGNVIWSFSPSTYAGYPAVVRREIKVNPQGNVFIEMKVLCQASKLACDALVKDFVALNEGVRESVQARIKREVEKQ
jgi:hypothetical protein